MIKLAGCWELGWLAPLTEVDLWQFPLKDFAVDHLYMTPVSGISRRGLTEFANIEAVISENPDLDIIFVDENGSTDLAGFDHPESALYVFGKAGYSPIALQSSQHRTTSSLRVETNSGSQGRLWPHQAASIVLYDRLMKGAS